MKDKRLEYTAMDDTLPKRGGKESDDKSQAADPPDNAGSGRSYVPSDANAEPPQNEPESPEGSA